MLNFELYNPVNLVFGKGQMEKLPKLIPADAKILLAYGGGSIFSNGVHAQVTEALKGHDITEFGGIEPNPRYETLMKAVELIREKKLDFILAVGGGSVIDGVKFISAAVNGLIQKGVPTDWATHMIGHELTALYGIDHARTLAIIAPSLYKVMFETKKEKLAQYGRRVWDIAETDVDKAAELAIAKTVDFFTTMGMPARVSEYTEDYQKTADIIVNRFEERGWKAMGERGNITPDKVREIVEMSY